MNGRVTIRIAESSDALSLTSLINDAFRCAENFFVEQDRLDLEEVHKLLGTGKFLLAQESESVLGCVYIEPKLTTDGRRAYLGLLSVDPGHQRDGLGSQLMNAAEEYCRD